MENNEYVVTVTATDRAEPLPESSATVTLTVTVTDVDEPPAKPLAPTVEAAGSDGLTVQWEAPDNAGRPDIKGYDLQYQVSKEAVSGEALFAAGPQDVPATDTRATITGLSAGTTYNVVVRADNEEGAGAWSKSGSGATDELLVTVTPDTLTVPEGGSAGYTVVLNTLPTADVTITVARASDADTDLTATTAALTFTTTNYADAQTVTVEAATDTDQLDGTATFDHTAVSMDPSYNGIAIESVTAMEDDRTLLITDLADAEVAENEVWTSATPMLSGADGTVTWELSGADADAFEIDSGTRKLTLPAQNYEVPADRASTDPVNAAADNEYVVTVTATDSASPPPAGSGTVTLTVTVTDANDPPTGQPEISGTAQVGETLTAATGDIADEDGLGTFSYQWQAAGADIAGATAATYEPVAAYVGDTLTVVASFTDGGGTKESVASALTAAVLTASTEQQGSTVAFGAGSYRASEGGTAATVTVTLSPAPTAEVEIPLTAVGLDGATDGDWSGVPGNVTFAASETSQSFTSQSFTVSATDDRVDDDGESVLLAFGTLPAGVTEGTPDTATVAIEDDDTRGVTVSETKLTVDEGGSDDYTVVLTSEPTGDVTVTVGGESVDVTADPTTLTFTDMQWDTVQTVTVSAAEDPDAQAEAAVTLTHTVSGADYGAVSAGGVTVTVVETDTPTLSVAAAKASESAGAMAFEVTLSVASSDAITVDYETSDDTGDTATAGSDYTATSGTLTFPVDTTAAQTISVPVTDDDDDETAEEETFTLTLSNAMDAALAGGEATLAVSGTIVDDDDPQVTVEFGAADYTVREGETVDVQVTLSLDPERTVEIPLTATDQGQTSAADYSGVPASLTFDVGDKMKTFTFAAIDDDDDDDDDSVELGFGTTLPAGVTAGSTTTATVRITDDDAAPGTNTATGQPVIPTTVYMFEPVVANTDAIADADGLSDPQFRYQWWAGDTGDTAAAAITGATLKRFTPGEDQFGRWLQVVVSFTDDLDHKETVSSERSLPVRTRATDYTQPLQVSLGSRAPDPVGAEFTVEFSFFIEYNGEPVMGFELADITVSNGTASELRLDVNRYAVTITPATLGEEVTVQVPAGAVWWAGDSNKLNQASPVLTRQTEVDEVPPVASMKLHNGRGPLSGPYELGVTFSERVRELQREDFTVMPAEATLSHVALGASGKYGVVRVTPPDAEYAGTITVTLNAGAVLDFGDNGNESAVSLRRDLEADDKPPRVWVWSSYFGEEEIGLGDRHLYLGSSDWVYGLKKYRVKLQDAADESDTIGASLRGPWYDHTTLYVKVAERESYPECLKLTVKAGAFEDWVGQPVAEQVLYLTNGWQVRNCPPPEAPEEEESAGAEGVLPVTVTWVSVAADANRDGSWTAGEAVEVTVRFSEAVTVDTGGGTPGLAVVVGAASREAGYAGGTGTAELMFAYLMTAADGAVGTVLVEPDSLALNGGTIRSEAGVDAELSHLGAGLLFLSIPVVSVADASATEGSGVTADFAVTLDRAATWPVTVDYATADYATADGTARAGEDYTAAAGTLSFAAGDTEKTVAVTILDDAVDEGEERFALRLNNAAGAVLADDAEAVGTIVNSGPLPRAWLAHFGRTAAGHVLAAVGERLTGPAAGGSQVTIGGQRLSAAAPSAEQEEAAFERRVEELMKERRQRAGLRTMELRELLTGSSFALAWAAPAADGEAAADAAGDADAGGQWTLWGRAAWSHFTGGEDGLRLNGDLFTGTLGADYRQERLLAGLALAYSTGAGSFEYASGRDGDLYTALASVHPYVRVVVHERLAVWGLFGYGLLGELTLDEEGAAAAIETDAGLLMGAFGARGTLLAAGPGGGLELAAKGDGLLLRMSSAAARGLVATQADVSRWRLLLEASYRGLPLAGGVLTPALEVGGRYDGGDAQTGTGLVVGGSLRYALPAWGLTLTGSGRGLLHESGVFSEWGAGGSVRFDPGAPGRGVALRVAPSWGGAPTGAAGLWSLRDASRLAALRAVQAAGTLDAEVSYGLGVSGGRAVMTPYAGFAHAAQGDRAWRVGARVSLDRSLDLSLEATRNESAGDRAAEHGLVLSGSLRW